MLVDLMVSRDLGAYNNRYLDVNIRSNEGTDNVVELHTHIRALYEAFDISSMSRTLVTIMASDRSREQSFIDASISLLSTSPIDTPTNRHCQGKPS